jgi:hypothetical protein
VNQEPSGAELKRTAGLAADPISQRVSSFTGTLEIMNSRVRLELCGEWVAGRKEVAGRVRKVGIQPRQLWTLHLIVLNHC